MRLFFLFLLNLSFLSTVPSFAFELPSEEVLLEDIRAQIQLPQLSADDLKLTLDQVALIYDQIYSHTDIKIQYFNNPSLDPYPRIKAISQGDTISTLQSITRITLDLRDLHQSFHWPRPYACLRTFVPLELGLASVVPFDRRVVVKNINIDNLKNESLKQVYKAILSDLAKGTIITKINGEDVWSALKTSSIYGGGSNPDAYLYEGLFYLTYSSQRMQTLPPQNHLTISYMANLSAQEKTLTLPYLTKTSISCQEQTKTQAFESTKKPKPFFVRQHPNAMDFRFDSGRAKSNIESRIDDLKPSDEPTVKYGTFQNKKFGYLRITEFSPEKEIEDAQKQIESILRSFQESTEGLVIDVRGNPGGVYGDYLTQFFSAIKVVSQMEEIRASDLNLKMLEKMDEESEDAWMKAYLAAVKNAKAHGRRYSDRVIVNTEKYLNEKGRIYFHPVIILADPSCYSYCDYFATSMQDHFAAEVWIENGAHTGGGGGSVSSYEGFSMALPEDLKKLPQQIGMGIAFSTGYRTGPKAGVPIENRGADADRIYHTSFRDVVEGDVDLLNAMAEHLAQKSRKLMH